MNDLSGTLNKDHRLSIRDIVRYLGPAFLVSVGYMDPGNWATNIAGGANYNYSLLWVILVSNLMAILLQSLSAKLGLVTGKNLAENCREQFSRPTSISLWITAELAMMATDLAEFLGAAIGFNILFAIPLTTAALLTAVAVFLILGLEYFGYRKLEFVIIGLVSIVGACYFIEVVLSKPSIGTVVYHTFVPELPMGSVLIAVGILGATVMPHNLFLHSELIKTRLVLFRERKWSMKSMLRFAYTDSIVALNIAFLVNASMVIMSAAVFYSHGLHISSIEEAHTTLAPLVGNLSSLVFAIALLAAGLSSSVTGTMAGQVVMGGFLNYKMSLWLRRAITMIPALVVIWLRVDTLQVLVLSQVMLSLQLPFSVVPLVLFTGNKKLLGSHVNSFKTKILAVACTLFIIALNIVLIVETFRG